MANLEYNFNQNDYDIVKLSDPISAQFPTEGTYIRLSVLDENGNYLSNANSKAFYSTLSSAAVSIQVPSSVSDTTTFSLTQGNSDFVIYQNTSNDVDNTVTYIKPNEILNSIGAPQGNYILQFEFLKQYQPTTAVGEVDYFVIKEISPTRFEVRLKLLDNYITQQSLEDSGGSNWLNDFLTTLGTVDSDGNYTHAFKHVLYIGGINVPIVNVTFDDIKDGNNNQSIILKLYEKLPSALTNLETVTIEEELLISQTQKVLYFSDVVPGQSLYSLKVDTEFDHGYTDLNGQNFQNLDTLTGSLSQEALDNITTGSYFEYKNLNTDFRFFNNHSIFGSAKRKIENFKNKVETIQSYYSDISSSLSWFGVSSASDASDIVQLRKNYFTKIRDEIKTFTPYEKFLYYDVQSTSTASAPGIKNYAHTIPVSMSANDSILNRHDGFDIVYKHNSPAGNTDSIDYFKDTYYAHKKPFFNYSSSIYLSFLIKGGGHETHVGGLTWDNSNQSPGSNGLPDGTFLPSSTHYQESTLTPTITSSEYRRFIYHTSMSYFQPNESVNFDLGHSIEGEDFTAANGQVTILSGSIKTGSFPIQDSAGTYGDLLTVITESGVTFSGSVMPAGELFRISLPSTVTTNATSSLITDVKVTLETPTDILPFDNLYHTSSTNWQNWYNGIHSSASAYDEINIHSLENNLPDYIQRSSQFDDFKKFLSLIGEQTDLIRNYVDNFDTFNNRNYDKIDSVPGNLLPILIDNMGWDPIQPFTGSIASYYGNLLSSNTNIKNIEENTWRKTLNNLLFLYKSKGTKNSVRALMNIYGYPPDVLSINEFGGSTQPQNDHPISPSTPLMGTTNNDTNLQQAIGNVSYYLKPRKLYHYRFNNKSERILRTDWWMDNANANTVEFVYKHKTSPNDQIILTNSGSGAIKATGTITITSPTTSDHDGGLLRITSSDGTRRTYIFDDDNDGASGTTDGSGRVRIQINGFTTIDEIATEVSTSISHPNGHRNKISVDDSNDFLTSDGLHFVTSDGKFFEVNSSGSMVLTQVTASHNGNRPIISTAPSASVSGFTGGSDNQHLWDLRLKSSSDNISSSFQFRLNNTSHASASISASNAVSMSTNYLTMSNGSLWNVMLQRMTASISGSGTNKYQLVVASQKGSSIHKLAFTSMSVSGGLNPDSNYYANQNWQSTGSRHQLSSSNFVIGNVNFSASLAEFRTWKTALSMSKFRLHTLNKFSTVGNDIDAHTDDLIYHFRLNENYNSSSISSSTQTTINIIDSNPNGPDTNATDYTFTMPSNIATGSTLYGFDLIELNSISLQDSTQNLRNDNKIVVKPNVSFNSNLNPFTTATKGLNVIKSRVDRATSTKLEINSSPQDFVNNFILEKVQSFNFEKKYGNPLNMYSSSHTDLENYRKNFFTKYEVSVNTNRFIRAHENIFNKSLIDGIEKVLPARSTLGGQNNTVGVTIKPTILEKQKVKHQRHSVEVNPNLVSGSISVPSSASYKSGFTLSQIYNAPKTGSISINNVISKSFSFEVPKTGSISINNVISKSFSIDTPKTGSISINNVISKSFSIDTPRTGSFSVVNSISKSFSYEAPKTGSISINNVISKSSSVDLPNTGSFSIVNSISKSFSVDLPKTASLSVVNSISKSFSVDLPKTASITFVNNYISSSGNIELPITGTNNYINTNYTKKFVNLHDSWGTSSSDVHFLNMAHTKGDSTFVTASLSFTFIQSASNNSTITLESLNADRTTLTVKTYEASGSFTNGAFSGDSSSILFSTGSGTTIGAGSGSVAGNFLAAVTSSNGHSSNFVVSQNLGVIRISQSIGGVKGNTALSYNAKLTSSLANSLTASLFVTFSGGTTTNPIDEDLNVNHVEPRNHFYMIGDLEIYSGSRTNESDFSNFRNFFNRQNLTEFVHSSITYESYINGNPGAQTGRAIGKTRYFYTSSNGTITFPSNHVRKFSQPFVDRMYQGTQNTSPGFMMKSDYDDLSTSSFYRVKTSGNDNKLIVKNTNPEKEGKDKLM